MDTVKVFRVEPFPKRFLLQNSSVKEVIRCQIVCEFHVNLIIKHIDGAFEVLFWVNKFLFLFSLLNDIDKLNTLLDKIRWWDF